MELERVGSARKSESILQGKGGRHPNNIPAPYVKSRALDRGLLYSSNSLLGEKFYWVNTTSRLVTVRLFSNLTMVIYPLFMADYQLEARERERAMHTTFVKCHPGPLLF